MAEFTIRQMGFAPSQVKKEIFEVPRVTSTPFSVDPTPRNVTVIKNNVGHLLSIRFPESVLDVALSNEINIAYSCKAGICGSCVVKCTKGTVRMRYNDVLTDQEISEGLILTCVAHPESDITIEL
jgi:ring-1,2-phenylacetyl-CoA epoxidase subunit PaaE